MNVPWDYLEHVIDIVLRNFGNWDIGSYKEEY